MSQYYDRFNIALEPAESDALVRWARIERRTKTAQAAWAIRQSLKQLGLLPPANTPKREATINER